LEKWMARSMIGHQPALGVGDAQLQEAVRPDAPPLGEAPVADVERAVPEAEVAQDVRAGLALQGRPELGEDRLQLGVVRRVDGDELAARPAVGVLDVAQQHALKAADELERDPPLRAVVEHHAEDVLGVAEARRDVHLPALGRDVRVLRPVDEPVVRRRPLPARGHRPVGDGEVDVVAPGDGAGVVEVRVRQAELVVAVVHEPPSSP